jgi:hypothetical protein
VGGGADPDPPDRLRQYAPRSILTFGRAVSGDDYEVLAAQAPGVVRARAYWAWDGAQQRSVVKVYVGDDAAAVDSARAALAAHADPNRPRSVLAAVAVPVRLSLTARVRPDYQPRAVSDAVRAALLEARTGLFGVARVRIGEAVYDSKIFDACAKVPGVVAVHALRFEVARGGAYALEAGPRHAPGEGRFHQLTDAALTVSTEVATDAALR